MDRAGWMAKSQGLYWSVTGIWPLLHMPSFLWVTGPKEDLWLVRTVGILIALIGLVLLAAGVRKRVTPELKWLGIGGAAGLAFIDIYYSLTHVIRNIYLLDGLAEIVIILLWLFWVGRTGIAQAKPQYPKQNQHD